MPCVTEEPPHSWPEHLETALCYAARFLSKEQMEGHHCGCGYINLLQWYIEHLGLDLADAIKKKDKEREGFCKNELVRLGESWGVDDFGLFYTTYGSMKMIGLVNR